ncbi:MAG: 30S ribosomal protein S5 [Elusimicrobia bacterium]|nr:30S ribosomal protein S5 [Elusimicrobiota bacterium]
MLKNQKQLRTEKELNADGLPKAEALAFEAAPEEKAVVVAVNRVTKVVKGGKRFSFNALVVVGDGMGTVGVGLGKSNEVQSAIQKATSGAKKEMFTFPILDTTIPHEIEGRFGAGHVWMKPAVGGTGLIAGGGVRAVLEAGGVRNVLTKNLGSRNAFNTVYATLDALKRLKSKEAVMKLRGQ